MSESGGEPSSEPNSEPPQYIGFVRPPPEAPLSEQAQAYQPLVTLSGCLIFIALFLMLSGCGVVLFLAFAGWGMLGVAAAAMGFGALVLAIVLRVVARWLQNRPPSG